VTSSPKPGEAHEENRASASAHSEGQGRGCPPFLDAKAYQEVASQLDAMASIRRGLAQARKGVGRPADEVFDELEAR